MFYVPAHRHAPLWTSHNGSRDVTRWLDNAFDPFFKSGASKLRVEQDEKAYTLSLDVPGLSKEQLRIEIEGAVLRIQSQDDAPRSLRVAYELPTELDAAASQAKLENGVLTLRLVKLLPASKAVALSIG